MRLLLESAHVVLLLAERLVEFLKIGGLDDATLLMSGCHGP